MEALPPEALRYNLDNGEASGGLPWQHSMQTLFSSSMIMFYKLSQRKPLVSLRSSSFLNGSEPKFHNKLVSQNTHRGVPGCTDWFSTMDLATEYNQVRSRRKIVPRLHSALHLGCLSGTTRPLGFVSPPRTFQRLMQWIFSDQQCQSFLLYLYEIVIFSPTEFGGGAWSALTGKS